MSACQDSSRCVAVATSPKDDPKFCAIHRRCDHCGTTHPHDTAVYQCTACRATMCVARTEMDPDLKDRKKIRRIHKPTSAFVKCGPVERAA